MFTFQAYKEHLLSKRIELNIGKRTHEGIPLPLRELYKCFNGMVEGFTETENSIEIYSIEKAITVTKTQLNKYPKLRGKLALVFGDVLLESHFLAIQNNQSLPQFLFDDTFINIADDASSIQEIWSEVFSFKIIDGFQS